MAIVSINLYYKDPQNISDPCVDGGTGNQVTAYFDDNNGAISSLSQIAAGNVSIYDDPFLSNLLSSGWYGESPYPDASAVDIYAFDNSGPDWVQIQICSASGGGSGYGTVSAWFKDPAQIDPSLSIDETNPCVSTPSASQIDIYFDPNQVGGTTSLTLAQAVVNGVDLFSDTGLSQTIPDGWWADSDFPDSANTVDVYLWYGSVWENPNGNASGEYTTCAATGSTSGTSGSSGTPGVYSINATYATDSDDLCQSGPDPGVLLFQTYYYYGSTGPLTLAQIVAANIPVFYSFNAATAYSVGSNPQLVDAIDTGFYREFDELTYHFWENKKNSTSRWVPQLSGTCTPPPQPQVWTIDLYIDPNYTTPEEWCCGANPSSQTFYYYTENQYFSLMNLANAGVLLYTTSNAAEHAIFPELIPPGIYAADLGNSQMLQFAHDDGSGSPKWIGLDDNSDTTTNPNITQYFSCENYVTEGRGTGYSTTNIQSVNPFANRVFYAFWSCIPIDGQFEMYVFDGRHFSAEENFMSDFVETLVTNNNLAVNTGTELGCVSYQHKIIAENIDEAVNIVKGLKDNGVDLDYPAVIEAELSDLGVGDNVTLSISPSCCDCILRDNISLYEFGETGIPAPTGLGPNFEVERNAKLDNVAKPLLRTNPKLTTNVKLVVNSKDELFLDSIDATDALASADYKKFPINPRGSYAYDLTRFYTKNKTPLEIVYTTKRRDSDFSVYSEYEKQIEEDYHYGTTINYSKLYDEEFRMFAPIYVDLNMPKKFVIYRIKDPRPSVNIGDSAAGNYERIRKLIDNADIVKVFDLTKDSNLGKYLRNYVQDQSFPKAPITFSFEENEKTTFNGIDLIKGGFTKKAEYVHSDFILKDKPMIAANDFITDGFRRNNMAAANVINMEFLFDDPEATTYSVNRYIGLYVDDIETGNGDVSSVNRGNIMFKEVSSNMSSTFDYAAIPSYKMLNNMPILAYARTGDNYYKIDSSTTYDHSRLELRVLDPLNKIPAQLGIKYKDESIDMLNNSSAGFDFMKVSVVDVPNYNDKIALVNVKNESYRFTFVKFVAGVNIEIEDSEGNAIQFNTGGDLATAISNLEAAYSAPFADVYSLETSIVNGKASFILTEKLANLLNLSPSVTVSNGCVLNRVEIYTNVEIPDRTYYAADPDPLSNDYLPKGTFNGKYFSSAGNTRDIAIALTKLIRNRGLFDAFNIGSDIYISVKIPGYKIMQHALLNYKNNVNQFLQFENINSDVNNELGLSSIATATWDPYFFKGGNLVKKSILVNKETAPILNIGDYIPTAYRDRYNKVVDIVENINDPSGDYLKVILSLENSIDDGEVRVFAERRLTMGLFSAYSIYDMDFDFHDTANSELKELKHETTDQIIYDPYNDTKAINVGANDLSATDILSADYEILPEKYFANLQPLLSNETVDDVDIDAIDSEYERLNENEIKEYAVGSRVVPNVNKWVLKNGITVREEPYHLNANSAFGRTNFAPDLEVTSRDRKAFTHEWFYIHELPDYLRFWQINDTFSYINFIKGFDLSKSQFKRVDRDYFDMFMVGEGHEIELYNEDPLSRDTTLFNINSFIKSNLRKKYTLIDNGSSETFANTIFKGLNVVFKKRKEFVNSVASEFVKDTEFNGYKFSTMLKFNNQADNNSIEYEVIQNKKFKYVIFYITLNTGDAFASDVNRKLLYELKHQLSYNATTNRYEYSDITTSGALDLKSISFVGSGPYTVFGIDDVNGGKPNFKSQLSKNSTGTYNKLEIDLGTIGVYEVEIISVESDNELLINDIPNKVGAQTTDPDYYLDTVALNIVDLKNATYTYRGGGFGAQALILNELAAGNVASVLNKNNDEVTYVTVEEDGTINNNKFTINFLDGKEIVKKVDLGVTEDIEKPKSYKLLSSDITNKLTGGSDAYIESYSKSKKTIGYNIVAANEYYNFMVRHSGDYTIDLEPVVTFTDVYTHFKTNRKHSTLDLFEIGFETPLYKHSLTSSSEINIARSYYNKFNRCGVAFNVGFIKDSNVMGIAQGERIVPQASTHDLGWGKIKNHYYHKVNEINPNGVLKLTKGGDFLPVYPLIDEIAIDYKDVNVFKSSWENNYYTRSLAGGNTVEVPGTFDTAEERSYLGSTVMKLKDAYFLTEFTVQRVGSEEELDDILRTNNNDRDVVLYEDKQVLIADFYMNDVVYQKLSDLGALNTLTLFIDPANSIGDKTTLSDDMQDYVNKNLINAFTIDQIDLWISRFKGAESNILSTTSIDLLDNGGFTKDQSFTYRLHGDTPLNFRLIYNKRLGYSYDIRPMIKIQS